MQTLASLFKSMPCRRYCLNFLVPEKVGMHKACMSNLLSSYFQLSPIQSNIDLTLLACQRPFFLEIDLMKIGVCLFALPLLRLLDL